jgi:molybdopterin/thiamine biosynthesis adenylyltransferase
MFSRNQPVIPQHLQAKLAEITLLCAGAGMGSAICELAARTGVRRFIIADGDEVELSNLNRQSYARADIGKNKAESVARRLASIDPEIEVDVLPVYLQERELREYIPRATAVVNTIDFDDENFQRCSDLCRKFGKLELFATNLGFGGSVACFLPNSPTLSERFGTTDHRQLKRRILDFLLIENPQSPAYIRELYAEYLRTPPERDPQTGISTWLNAAMVVNALVRYGCGEEIRVFPEIYYADFNGSQ